MPEGGGLITPGEISSVLSRLQALERGVLVLTTSLTAALVLLITLGSRSPAASQPQVVRAQAVEVTDDAGHVRIALDAGGGKPAVWLFDPSGRRRIGLWVDYKDDPGLWMFDGLARPRIGLKVSAGESRLWLFENPTGRLSFVAP